MDTEEEASGVLNPLFLQNLETRLQSQILTYQQTISEGNDKIEEYKKGIQEELQRRKTFKAQIEEYKKRKAILEPALGSLKATNTDMHENSLQRRANVDVETKLYLLTKQSHAETLENYSNKWEIYKAEYEQFPLAIVRRNAKLELERGRIALMVAKYKMDEIKKIIKHRQTIIDIRARALIVDCANLAISRRSRVQNLNKKKAANESLKEELATYQAKLSSLRKEQEEQIRMKEMNQKQMRPLPDISLLRTKTIAYSSSNWPDIERDSSVCDFSDTSSINTQIIEEMLEDGNTENPSLTPQYKQPNEADLEKLIPEESEIRVAKETYAHNLDERSRSHIEINDREKNEENEEERDGNAREEKNEEYEPEPKVAKIVDDLSRVTVRTPLRTNVNSDKLPEIKMVQKVNYNLSSVFKHAADAPSFRTSKHLESQLDSSINENTSHSGCTMDFLKDNRVVSRQGSINLSQGSPDFSFAGEFSPLQRRDDDLDLESIASSSLRDPLVEFEAPAQPRAGMMNISLFSSFNVNKKESESKGKVKGEEKGKGKSIMKMF